MTDYKKYSLGQLENFLYDAMGAAEATPQEIYDVIKGVVEDNYYTYKKQASDAYELLSLLNGNGVGHLTCDKDDTSPECKQSWNDFWEEPKDKVKKWILPIEEVDCDECIINFPDDLLEAANLKEGDEVEWIDQGDGSFKMIKVTKPLGIEEC